MAIGNVYKLAVLWENVTTRDDAVNVFHFRQKTANVYVPAPVDLVEAFIGQAEGNYRGVVNSQYGLSKYVVTQVTGGVEMYERVGLGVGTAGTAGSMLPTTDSPLISWRTGFAGRRNRGRTFLPPSDEVYLSGGMWTSTFIALVESCALGMMNVGTHASVLYGQWEIGVWSAVGAAFKPFTGAIARVVPATMKSRRIGSGS